MALSRRPRKGDPRQYGRGLHLTPSGIAAACGEPDPPALPRGEWCVYGKAWGTYTFACADSPEEMVDRFHDRSEIFQGSSRVIRVRDDEPMSHRHGSHGECIPVIYPYVGRRAWSAKAIINRAILAGYEVHHI